MKLRAVELVMVLWGALLSASALAGDVALLLGEWHAEGASVPIPNGCEKLFYRYRSDGTLEAIDGKALMTMRYTAVSIPNGFLVRTSYVSDNGLKNCQGLSPEFVREHNVDEVLLP